MFTLPLFKAACSGYSYLAQCFQVPVIKPSARNRKRKCTLSWLPATIVGPRRNLGANLDEFIDLQKRRASTDRVSFAEGERGAMSAHEPGPPRPGATVPHLVMFALIRRDVLICRRDVAVSWHTAGRDCSDGFAPFTPTRAAAFSCGPAHERWHFTWESVTRRPGRLRRVLNYSLAPCQPCSADSWSTDGSECPHLLADQRVVLPSTSVLTSPNIRDQRGRSFRLRRVLRSTGVVIIERSFV